MPFVVDQFDDWVTYIPDVGENRLEPEPMTVEIQCLSTAEYKAIQRKWGQQLQGKNGLSRAQRMVEKIITERVQNVQLCTLKNHTTGEMFELKTGADLVAHAPSTLIDDIFTAITDASHLSTGTKKNLISQFDSSVQATQPLSGIADLASVRAESSEDPGVKLSGS